uniref:hypothetical protein n=1 Tax=Candidatus Bandiella numerosa TaxID=2570586 RepID=UPI001F22E746
IKDTVLDSVVQSNKDLEVVEMDELWHYVQKKRENYGYGLLTLVPEKESLPVKLALVVSKL